MYGNISSLQTAWKTFGAPTKLASADERVAAKIPIITAGDQIEIFCITFGQKKVMYNFLVFIVYTWYTIHIMHDYAYSHDMKLKIYGLKFKKGIWTES